ncbi:MAG: GT2 family glycosyltransferase [Candidatus Azotimanducaceae bacterium]|jgi:GT2 family glycosyltransferase
MWILRDFDGALKFVEWLIVNSLERGFFPVLGDLISKVAFLRKADHLLYQNWIRNIESIPPLTVKDSEQYDVILMLESADSPYLQEILEKTVLMNWVGVLLVILPIGVPRNMIKDNTIKNGEKIRLLDFDAYRAEFLRNDAKNNIALIHTLGLIEAAWVPKIDALLGMGADLVLSDHDLLGKEGFRYDPVLKPGFSRELIFDPAYAPCLFLSKELFRRCLENNPLENNNSDHGAVDVMANIMSSAEMPKHLEHVLIHLVEKPLSWLTLQKPFVEKDRKFNLRTHLSRFPEVYKAPTTPPLVSIIIPIRDNITLLIDCVRSVKKHQYKSKYEIVVLDNQSSDPQTLSWLKKSEAAGVITCLKCDFDFNWSKLNNVGIEHATGDVFVLLNNDTLVITPDWLDRLAALALEEDVGVVGPLLLYPDGCIQHAGVVVGYGGFADHLYLGEPVSNRSDEHFVSPFVRRDVSACTGACQVFTKKFYQENGPFNERLRVTGDIEFCIRAQNRGFRNLYDPSVSLYHLESKTRTKGLSKEEKEELKSCLGELTVLDDQYFNSNLSRSSRSPMFTLLKREETG